MKRTLTWFALLWLTGCAAPPPAPQDLVRSLAGPEGVEAYSHLMGRREPEVLSALGEGLRHPSARVRTQCVRLVTLQKDITWAPELKRLLQDPEESVRAASARALVGLIDTAECLQVLRNSQVHENTRLQLLDALLRDSLELCEPDLVDWLASLPASTFLDRAQRIQLQRWSPKAAERLRDAETRELLQRSTSRLAARNLELWNEGLSQPARRRLSSLRLYALYSGPKAAPTLKSMIRDSRDPLLRACALNALGWSQSPEALTLMKDYLGRSDSPPELRQLVIKGLGRLPEGPERRQLLFQCAARETPENRQEIALAFSCSRDKSVIPELEAWLKNESHRPTQSVLTRSIASLRGQCVPCEPCEPTH